MRKVFIFAIVTLAMVSLMEAKGSNVLDYLNSSTLAMANEPLPGTPKVPTVTPTGQCNTYTITESAPTESGAIYYWHTSPGTYDMSQSLASPITVTADQATYYIRTYWPSPYYTWSLSDQPVSLTIHSTPTVSVSAVPATLCVGNASVSSILTASGSATSFTWDNNLTAASTNTVSPSATTSYTVTGSDGSGSGCVSTATVKVTVVQVPPKPTISSNAIMCIGKSQTINATNAGNFQVNWLDANNAVLTSNSPSYAINNISADVTVKAQYQDLVNNCYSDYKPVTIKMAKAAFTIPATTVSQYSTLTATNASLNSTSYAWTMSGGVNENQKFTDANATFNFNILGAKTIKLVAINASCKDSTSKTVTVVKASGINDIQSTDQILVYPSPFTDVVNVDLTARNKDVTIAIYNLSGAKVAEKEIKMATGIEVLNTSTLPAGIYIIALTMDDITVTTKLKKE
jgi:hypothetical protein